MAELNLSKYGITGTTEIVHNPSYELLFAEETKPELEGFEKGQESELGAVNVMTGVYTGRSPKDKFIVMDENSKDTVWWTSDEYKNDNHPATQEAWDAVKDIALKELSNKKLYVVDAFCGANKDTRMAIRFIVEVAWQAHFVTNMFIQPTDCLLYTSDSIRQRLHSLSNVLHEDRFLMDMGTYPDNNILVFCHHQHLPGFLPSFYAISVQSPYDYKVLPFSFPPVL